MGTFFPYFKSLSSEIETHGRHSRMDRRVLVHVAVVIEQERKSGACVEVDSQADERPVTTRVVALDVPNREVRVSDVRGGDHRVAFAEQIVEPRTLEAGGQATVVIRADHPVAVDTQTDLSAEGMMVDVANIQGQRAGVSDFVRAVFGIRPQRRGILDDVSGRDNGRVR